MKSMSKKYPEYVVILNEDGHSEIIRCSNFNSAVKMYRRLCELYGQFSCQIFMEVVGYGEKI